MTDGLKERLRDNLYYSWGDESDVGERALARITDLEARLAAAEALALEYEHRHQRALSLLHEAEAGEDALAEAGSEARIALAGMVRPYNAVNLLDAALAAYEARRKG